MASGQAQQIFGFATGTFFNGDTLTITINGVVYTYVITNLNISNGFVAALNALPAFSAIYTAALGPILNGAYQIIVMANSFANSAPVVSCAYIGAGTLTFAPVGPTFVGGSGGANVSIQSQGGPIGSGIAAAVQTGGFIAQTGTLSSKNGIG